MSGPWTVARLRIDTLVVDGGNEPGRGTVPAAQSVEAALTAELAARLRSDPVLERSEHARLLRGDAEGDLSTDLDETVRRVADALLAMLRGEVRGG